MELTRLKANSQYRPCVDEKPYFSWVLTSEKTNVMQTSYHITVTGPEEVVWDSGIVESDKSIFVEYAGSPLKKSLRVPLDGDCDRQYRRLCGCFFLL